MNEVANAAELRERTAAESTVAKPGFLFVVDCENGIVEAVCADLFVARVYSDASEV